MAELTVPPVAAPALVERRASIDPAAVNESDTGARLRLRIPMSRNLTPAEVDDLEVGMRIKVEWDKGWFPGTVSEVRYELNCKGNARMKMYRITYDDRESSEVDLHEWKVRLLTEEEDAQSREWTMLQLRCCLSGDRLTDPGRFPGCAHHSRVNFGSLFQYSKGRYAQPCPVDGCDAIGRPSNVIRDHWLRDKVCHAQIRASPPHRRARQRGHPRATRDWGDRWWQEP